MALLRQLSKDKKIAMADISPVTTATTMQRNEAEIRSRGSTYGTTATAVQKQENCHGRPSYGHNCYNHAGEQG